MERVLIVGKEKRKLSKLGALLKKEGFKINSKNPELVISLGGDGTYLWSERKFPGVPKLMVRDSKICFHCEECNYVDVVEIIDKLKKRKFKIKQNIKLQASVRNKKLIGTNDIVIRNSFVGEALRFGLEIEGKVLYKELIGDGVVIATPFGSTGYFHSIARRKFGKGIGIAYNNLNVRLKHPVVSERSRIKVRILRGEAVLCTDNNKDIIRLKKGDSVVVRKAGEKAKLLKLDG